jgi:hypothetical protein
MTGADESWLAKYVISKGAILEANFSVIFTVNPASAERTIGVRE